MTDNALERVRKLLAKAEDPGCTPEEAAALNAKAAELIAKYGSTGRCSRRLGRRPTSWATAVVGVERLTPSTSRRC